jgi:hypothetical protein
MVDRKLNDYKKADIAKHEKMPEGCTVEQYDAYSRQYDELVESGKLGRVRKISRG